MKTSVIIPTYNRAHLIHNPLESLEKQEVMPDEVLVIIDGSTDGTAEFLRSRSFKLPLRVIEQPNGGRAQVRNRGAREALGDLLIFLDDDLMVSPRFVQAHLQFARMHPGSIAVGNVDPGEVDVDTDFVRFKHWLHQHWTHDMPTAGYQEMKEPFLSAANCSLSKEMFEKLGGFDQRLRDAEDYDMAVRAAMQGIRLYVNCEALAWNNDVDNITCRQYVKRLRGYSEAQRMLEEIKPELYSGQHRYKIVLPTGWKKMIFSFFCKRYWVNSVDKGTWSWMPLKYRYKLYDMILTANGSFFPDKVAL